MGSAKGWVFVAIMVAAFGATATVVSTVPKAAAAPEKVVVEKNHWRHHDGHWSYWHEGDKRWYYTDGSNWFYQDGNAWKVYSFDKGFGREGFERGEYKIPDAKAKVVIPRHETWRPR
jgi:photosystem II stability/assembly factor-like uncharacterized protein